MKKNNIIIILSIITILLTASIAAAHVPYIERSDYSEDKPFYVWKMIEKSKAFYAWLENDVDTPSEDIDVYKFKINNKPKNVYIEIIVPVIENYYENFVPWFALVGPNLPSPNQELPFEIPEGYGAIIKENVEQGVERETFYEYI